MNPDFWSPTSSYRTLGDKIIVSAGTEPKYYEQLHSTRLHCTKYAPEAWQLFYYGYPDGCPTQKQRQYAFKIYALDRVVLGGFPTILWMDAAFQPVGSLAPLWKEIEEHGWYVHKQGDAVLGAWCSDAALAIFGISRDVAMTIPLCYSGIVGLNIHNSVGAKIWERWKGLYHTGAFDGPHQHMNGRPMEAWGDKLQAHCSDDPRCFGHRHDEAALSWLLWDMGLVLRTEPFIRIDNADGFIGHHVRLHAD